MCNFFIICHEIRFFFQQRKRCKKLKCCKGFIMPEASNAFIKKALQYNVSNPFWFKDLSEKRIHNGNRGQIGVICVVSSLSYHKMNFCSLSKIEIHKNVRWCSNKIWKDREYNETQNIISEFLTHFNEYLLIT